MLIFDDYLISQHTADLPPSSHGSGAAAPINSPSISHIYCSKYGTVSEMTCNKFSLNQQRLIAINLVQIFNLLSFY